MKILFDIYHLPQLNLYKHVIGVLGRENVIICCVDRGRLVNVIRKELPGFNILVFGDYKYNNGLFSMIFKIIIPRIIKLSKIIKSDKISLVISSGYQANLIAFFKNVPNIVFTDDKRKYIYEIQSLAANKIFMPSFNRKFKNIEYFNALKEWAYLSPRHFSQNIEVLNKYKIKEKSYIFIREVSTKTQNYKNQKKNLILQISKDIEKVPVILSLEDKSNSSNYPAHWIILEEPVKDIHSLMYFSKVVISSGDSMAREGAMLGIPSIYCGTRNMPANDILIDKGMLLHRKAEEIPKIISKILNEKLLFEDQELFRGKLLEEWDDITDLILNKIEKYRR